MVADRAQRHIERHQLGDRGRIPRIGGVIGAQHLAACGIDQDRARRHAGVAGDERAGTRSEPNARPSAGARKELIQGTCRGPFGWSGRGFQRIARAAHGFT